MNEKPSADRILGKLDEYLNKNDYAGAQRHLLYWLEEARVTESDRIELLVRNELIGLYRKLGNENEALRCASEALLKIEQMGIEDQVGSATTYLNVATAYKAFGMAKKALPVFEKALKIYENELEENDSRLGGLYNNMALALVDEGMLDRAYELYDKALKVMSASEGGALEKAITYLNIASAKEAELGLEMADAQIQENLDIAKELLDNYEQRNGYYAFVCEKCASVFGYYGHFAYENELKDRARRIYEGN